MKKRVFFIFVAALVCVCAFVAVLRHNQSVLSESVVAQLRDRYPVVKNLSPEGVYSAFVTLDMVKDVDGGSFVYGMMVSDEEYSSTVVSTGYPELDEKRENEGIDNTVHFFLNTFEVIDDSESMYEKGTTLTLSSNVIFKGHLPIFEKGQKYVIPVKESSIEEGIYNYTCVGIFYVTEDGYVLAAYDEEGRSEKKYTGMKVEQLLRELKK